VPDRGFSGSDGSSEWDKGRGDKKGIKEIDKGL